MTRSYTPVTLRQPENVPIDYQRYVNVADLGNAKHVHGTYSTLCVGDNTPPELFVHGRGSSRVNPPPPHLLPPAPPPCRLRRRRPRLCRLGLRRHRWRPISPRPLSPRHSRRRRRPRLAAAVSELYGLSG